MGLEADAETLSVKQKETGMKLDVEGLSKTYGKNKALCDMSYTFSEGVYAILGPNGAGKSTFFHLLTGTLKPDCGTVLYNGKDAFRNKRDYLSKIGFIPQQQELYAGFTLERFLWYMASLKGLSKKETEEEVRRVAAQVNLTEDLPRLLSSFSGGMRQRALIAQAFLGSPALLICDEPTSGLDPKERIRFREMVAEYGKKATVLISTHIVSDIENLAKEVIFLKKGSVIASGSPEEICAGGPVPGPMQTILEAFYMASYEEEQ